MTDSTHRHEGTSGGAHQNAAGPVPDAAGERAAERPLTEGEKDTVKAASTPVTAGAGALAGAAAGLVTGPFGPIGAAVGAIVGALGGAAVGAAGGPAATGDLYTSEQDASYRALWEDMPDRPADRTFDSMRPAFQFGHVAAQYSEFAGRDFDAVEPELRRRWPDELRAQAGEWEAVRRYVENGFSQARRQRLGEVRDTAVVGSGGSAVDPVELARARAGLSSVDEPAHRQDRELP